MKINRETYFKNKIFGDLTAIKYIGKNRNRSSIWQFKCSCGNLTERVAASVKAKQTMQHCGCKKISESTASVKLLYGKYKHAAKARKLEFLLSFLEFKELTSKNCYYCNCPPTRKIKGKGYKHEYYFNGIDRIDSNKGYILDNCKTCCATCNVAKASYTLDYFKEWSKNLYKNLVKIGEINE